MERRVNRQLLCKLIMNEGNHTEQIHSTFRGSKGAPEGGIQIEGAGKYNNVCLVPLIAVTKDEC